MHSKSFKHVGLSSKLAWILMGAVVGFVFSTIFESGSAHAISSRSRFDGPSLESESGDRSDAEDLASGHLNVSSSSTSSQSSEGRFILWPRVTVGVVMQDAEGKLHMVPLQKEAGEGSAQPDTGSGRRTRDAALSRCMDAVDTVVDEAGGLDSGLFLLPQGTVKQ